MVGLTLRATRAGRPRHGALIHICGLVARKAETSMAARQFRVELLEHGVVIMRAKVFHAARGFYVGVKIARR